MSDLIDDIGVFLLAFILILIGTLSLKHYFNTMKNGEAIAVSRYTPARYGEGMPIIILKGKDAISNAKKYLVMGIFYLLLGLPILFIMVYSWITE